MHPRISQVRCYLFWFLLWEVPWYGETEVNVLGFIGLSVLFILLGLAKAASRLNIGPQRLQRFRIEKHTLF
jgi:hypothetical protein